MKVNTWLSVLIPCYNVEPYLEECVRSVMTQWQEGVEVILLDDCSTDGTAKVIVALKEVYGEQLVCVQHKRNGGLSAARNTMLEQAQGTYIWFLDSDDALMSGAIAELSGIVKQYSPDLIMCDYHTWVPDAPLSPQQKGFHVTTFEPSRQLGNCPDQLFQGIFNHGRLHAWSKISKRSLWHEGLRFPEGKYFEDIWLAPRLALNVKSYYHCPSVWVKYRQRGGSILASRCNQKISDLSIALSGALDLWLEQYPDLSTQGRFAFTLFCAKCLRCCIKDAVKLGVQRSRLSHFREQFYQNCHLNKWGVIKAYLKRGEWLRLRRMLRYM